MRQLYEQCSICDGEGSIDPASATWSPGPAPRPGADGRVQCPGCGGIRFVAIGLTGRQVERIVRENDGLKARIRAAERDRDDLTRRLDMLRTAIDSASAGAQEAPR